VTFEGNGSDLRQLNAKRRDIFGAYLQMKPREMRGAIGRWVILKGPALCKNRLMRDARGT
jgi:hypothetical protein